MITVTTGRMPANFKNEIPPRDPTKLDREADALLHFGFRREAERLAHRAAELREVGR